jgi:uncharacterized protein (UPF0332 family)
MAFNAETVTHHKDAGKHSGTAAEMAAKHMGLGAFSKKIGEFVNKLVGKKQKAMIDERNAAQMQTAPAAPTAQPVTH